MASLQLDAADPLKLQTDPRDVFILQELFFLAYMPHTKKKKSFAFLKPVQNKRLLRLQTVCCNSLACSKNNKPHEGMCSLAMVSPMGLV